MTGAVSDPFTPVPAGLCTSCCHPAAVSSSRGSVFYLCQLSRTDPRFPRYPVLPVVECGGYLPTVPPKSRQSGEEVT